MKELRPDWPREMGILNITDQVGQIANVSKLRLHIAAFFIPFSEWGRVWLLATVALQDLGPNLATWLHVSRIKVMHFEQSTMSLFGTVDLTVKMAYIAE